MAVCVCVVASVVPSVKGFDEDSVASHSTTQDETQENSVAENGLAHPPHPFQGGYMLAASYWPKVGDNTLTNSQTHIQTQ